MARNPAPQQRMLELLSEVLAIARTLAPPPLPAGRPRSAMTGVYPHQSKYNPWRAYVWDQRKHRSVYLGAFPSVAKAKAARQAYRAGAPVISGTKSPLRAVA